VQKLRLKIKSIEPNGAVILVAELPYVVEPIDKKTGKPMTAKQFAKAKPGQFKPSQKQVHPIVRFQLVPIEGDKTKYSVDDVYEVELKKVK
jgi:hypothetical protein